MPALWQIMHASDPENILVAEQGWGEASKGDNMVDDQESVHRGASCVSFWWLKSKGSLPLAPLPSMPRPAISWKEPGDCRARMGHGRQRQQQTRGS